MILGTPPHHPKVQGQDLGCSRHPGGGQIAVSQSTAWGRRAGGVPGGGGGGGRPSGATPPFQAGGAGRGGRLSCLHSPPPRPPRALISVHTQRFRSITSCSCPSRGRAGAAADGKPPPGTPPERGRDEGGPRGNGGAPAWRTPEVEAERPRRGPPGSSGRGERGVRGARGGHLSPPRCPRFPPSPRVTPTPVPSCPLPSLVSPPVPPFLSPPHIPEGLPQAGKVWQGRGGPGRPRGPSARTGIPEGGGTVPAPPRSSRGGSGASAKRGEGVSVPPTGRGPAAKPRPRPCHSLSVSFPRRAEAPPPRRRGGSSSRARAGPDEATPPRTLS